jgi:hypothetical protein
MNFRRWVWAFCLGIFLISACKREENVLVVEKGNNTPADTLVSVLTQETFINKTYIALLGRKPDPSELQTALAIAGSNNFSAENRKKFINEVISKPEYLDIVYNINRANLLKNIDTLEIRIVIENFLVLKDKPNFAQFRELIESEITKAQQLRTIPTELKAGTLSVREMQKRMANNYFYDQINMGSLNYVLSLFETFLFRYPTQAEETAAVQMADGLNAVLFLREGKSKNDLVNIFFDSQDYFEGQVRDQYRQLLYRDPTSSELTHLARQYRLSNNFSQLQSEIIATNEYAGI